MTLIILTSIILLTPIIPLLAAEEMPVVETSVETMPGSRSSGQSGLGKLKQLPWYDKINTFASVGHEKRSLSIERRSTVAVGAKEVFSGDYAAQTLAFTSGGNLLRNTSLHLDLALTKLQLEGRQQSVADEAVQFERNKTLLELFVDHRLARRLSLGIDIYYGGDYFQNAGSDEKSYDEEMGGGLSLSNYFSFDKTDIKLSYIFSHRKINLGNNDTDDSSKRFHSLLTTVSHQWAYGLSSDINLRGSYYPKVDEFKYWESTFIWSIGTRLNYRLGNHDELSLNLDHLVVGSNSSSDMIALNYRHQFGSKPSKRRKRSNKLPRLLIK